MTAVNQQSLERQNIKDISDLSRLVPGVNATGGAGSTGGRTIVIRGIAGSGAATTGIYVDDTPIQARGAQSVYPNLFDLERVEVLRGPQGTLFGAGSQGGTVRFITPTPSLTNYSGQVRAEVANSDYGSPTYEAGAAVGGPLIRDKVGVRASLWTRHQGGYVDRYNPFNQVLTAKDTNAIDSVTGRVSVLVKASDNFTINPSIIYQQVNRKDADIWWKDIGLFKSYFQIPQPTKETFWLPSVAMEYQAPGFSVKSITSVFKRRQEGTNQFFHSSLQELFYPQVPQYTLADHINRTQKNFTQEIRVTTDADRRLTFVGGVFYTRNKETYYEDEDEPLLDQLLLAVIGRTVQQNLGYPLINGRYGLIQNRSTTDSEIAGFGEIGFKITSRLKATAGLRVSKTAFKFTDVAEGPYGNQAPPLGPLRTAGKASEKPVNPKFNLSYELDNGLIYATAAKGYRMGGANGALPNLCAAQLATLGITGAPPPYDSDSVWSYELGAKQRLMERRLEVAGSVFRIDWTGIQGSVPLNTCTYSYLANFGAARSQGFDLQAQYLVTENLLISGTVGHLDAKYTETVRAPDAQGNRTGAILALNGDPLQNTPKWQYTISGDYSWPIFGEFKGFGRADYRHASKFYRSASAGVTGNNEGIRYAPAVPDLSLRAGVRSPTLEIAAFMTNVTGFDTPLFQTLGTRANTYGSRAFRNTSARPRTYGVALNYRF